MKSVSPEKSFQLQAVDRKKEKTIWKNIGFPLFMSLYFLLEKEVGMKINGKISIRFTYKKKNPTGGYQASLNKSHT